MSPYNDPITFKVMENDGGYGATMPDSLLVTSKHGLVNAMLGTGWDLAAYVEDTDTWADTIAAEMARGYGDLDAAYIGNIEVDQQARGQGEARRLLTATLDWLDRKGVRLTMLYVVPCGRNGLGWADLVAWYGRHGFKYLTPQLTTTQALYSSGDDTSRVMFRVRPKHRPKKRSRK